ncbi:MAG: hypothetical protein AAGF71_13245 [Pseudomonadota bacterium]
MKDTCWKRSISGRFSFGPAHDLTFFAPDHDPSDGGGVSGAEGEGGGCALEQFCAGGGAGDGGGEAESPDCQSASNCDP